ncbi:MAG: MBL fold metallo-hydrolase [Bacteroidetes bacterium]|nr:MBL fold metallo-hydrolase [Bacteroidota bacterium]MDA1119607.1 MBL fold metallo-hydrolase [Bacteroidota bacterium]
MIHLIRNKIFPSNTYILTDHNETNCLIIDPGLDESWIYDQIQKINVKPVAILSTHGHFDHIAGVSFLKEKYNDIPFYLHEADIKISRSVNFYMKVAGIDKRIQTPVPDFLFTKDYEKKAIHGFDIDIYNLPGHSYGSCVIRTGANLFSGDIIYKKGLGFNSFPGEDRDKLRDSILKMFTMFPGKFLVLPGHGESEYLQGIKRNNIELVGFLETSLND